MPNLRSDQWAIHAGVNGVNFPPILSWTSLAGGDMEAQNTNVRPGGMVDAIELGGPRQRSDATVKRLYASTLHPYIVQLENAVGRNSMWISYTPLDVNAAPVGPTVTISGILKHVQNPEKDANAQAAAFLTLVMACHAAASISQ